MPPCYRGLLWRSSDATKSELWRGRHRGGYGGRAQGQRSAFCTDDGARAAVCGLFCAALGLAAGTSSALAAPRWGITVSQLNAYGAQGGSNPFFAELIGSGPVGANDAAQAFERGSGGNVFRLVVGDVADPTGVAPNVPVGAEVTVTDKLPEGMVLAGFSNVAEGTDWSCAAVRPVLNANGVYAPREVECILPPADSQLAAGGTYPPITLNVYVEPDAASALMNAATVGRWGCDGDDGRR